MRPRAVLFDLDDTILAWDAVAEPTWRRLCEEHGRGTGVGGEHLYATLCGVRDWYWSDPERHRRGRLDLRAARRLIVRETFARVRLDDAPRALAMADAYTVEREVAVAPFPGAVEALERLGASGIPLALLTNGTSEAQRTKVRRFGLEKHFRTILVEGELGFGKPHPAVYRRALADLGVDAEDAWMIGDHLEWDVSAPQALGIRAVWNDFRGTGLPRGSSVVPDRVVRSVSEWVRSGHFDEGT